MFSRLDQRKTVTILAFCYPYKKLSIVIGALTPSFKKVPKPVIFVLSRIGIVPHYPGAIFAVRRAGLVSSKDVLCCFL